MMNVFEQLVNRSEDAGMVAAEKFMDAQESRFCGRKKRDDGDEVCGLLTSNTV